MDNFKISIIGAGNMGGSIARGLYGCKNYQITISEPSEAIRQTFGTEYPNIKLAESNIAAVNDAQLLILAVKPYVVKPVLEEIRAHIDLHKTIVGCLAPTVPLEEISQLLNEGATESEAIMPQLVKIIPNTAIAVQHSMTFLAPNNLSDANLNIIKSIFEQLGAVAVVSEKDIPAATAVCSCGIAYAFRYIRAVTEGAVELGIRPTDAMRYEIETLKGACELLLATGQNPEVEIDKVTTPGGLTIKGLNAMEKYGFTNAVIEGLKASCK